MSSNVREITPANLKSIPTMLRYWAAMFERGEEPMPRSVLLIAIPTVPDRPPEEFSAGEELSRLEEIGALHAAAMRIGQTTLEPIGDPAARE